MRWYHQFAIAMSAFAVTVVFCGAQSDTDGALSAKVDDSSAHKCANRTFRESVSQAFGTGDH